MDFKRVFWLISRHRKAVSYIFSWSWHLSFCRCLQCSDAVSWTCGLELEPAATLEKGCRCV